MKSIQSKIQHPEPRPMILAVDKGGRPAEWLNWQKAACYYLGDKILWTVGDPAITLHGGVNRQGVRSILELHPVVAINGANARQFEDKRIPLTNANLFKRDDYTCLYCGERFPRSSLSRDHIVPQAKGGPDTWENTATACAPCNSFKGARTPEEAGMPLLALPFEPSHIEGLLLSNRNILYDQKQFLIAQRPNARRKLQ